MSDNDSDDCLILPDPDLSDFTPIKEENENPATEIRKEQNSNSDTETVSTIDLCQRRKKNNVSLSTYVARPSKESLKPHLDKLNSVSSAESVDSKLFREGKRRKVEVTQFVILINLHCLKFMGVISIITIFKI